MSVKVTNVGAETQFQRALKMNAHLTVLDLWANNISDEGAQLLSDGLKRNR
jgi:hypothetical protein